MNEAEYQSYVKSVGEFLPAIRNGYYTKKCLIDTVQSFYRKDAGKILTPEYNYELGAVRFVSVVLNESYRENLALSWNFQGEADGFLIYDDSGILIYETSNVYQHYVLIKKENEEKNML